MYAIWSSHHNFTCSRHDTGKSVTSPAARLPCTPYIFSTRKYVFGGTKLIERRGDIQGRLLPGHKWKYTVCNTYAEKVIVRRCLERSCGMEENKIWGENGKRGHNIQMADWDLASWVVEKVTETNGFLCLVWLRGCIKPEIMCWYLLGAAWRWLIIIGRPETAEKPLTSLQHSARPTCPVWLCLEKRAHLLFNPPLLQ